MELLIEELGGSVIMLLLGSGVIGVLVYVSTLNCPLCQGHFELV